MRVHAIFAAPEHGADMMHKSVVLLDPEKGIVVKRNDPPDDTPKLDTHITLIEHEAVLAAREKLPDLTISDPRRNIVTRGVKLDDLVDVQFKIGKSVILQGIRLCGPGAQILSARKTHQQDSHIAVIEALLHNGLYARIVQGGFIWCNDPITVL